MKLTPNTARPFYKWEVVLLLWFAYFLNQGDRQVFNTVLPHIQEFLGARVAFFDRDAAKLKQSQERALQP